MRWLFIVLALFGALLLINTYQPVLYTKQAFVMPVLNWSISYAHCLLATVLFGGIAKLKFD